MDFFLLRIFQIQLRLQCKFYQAAARALQSVLDNSPRLLDAESSIRAWGAVQNMLTAAANISKVLWGQKGRLTRERTPIRESIGMSETSPLRPVGMRNNFEHFDERIDRWWEESEDHHVTDLAIGDISAEQAGLRDIEMWRNLHPESMDILFWGERFSLKLVSEEVDRILSRLEAEFAKANDVALRQHQAKGHRVGS